MSGHHSTKKRLTAVAIQKMKSGSSDLLDSGDYEGLRVSKSSRGTFYVYRYQNFEKKMKQIRLGSYPTLSLAKAREELLKFKSLRASGKDPQEYIERQKERSRLEESKQVLSDKHEAFTFSVMVDLYLNQKVFDRYSEPDRKGNKKVIAGSRNEKGQKEVRRTLHGDVVRVMGGLPVITSGVIQVKTMIDQIINRGANVQAGNVLRELDLAYRFAISKGVLPEGFMNPCPEVKARLRDGGFKLTSKRGDRVLTDDEIKKLKEWLDQTSSVSPSVRNVLWFTLLTGLRTGEICTVQWKDLNLTRGTLHFEKTKNGTSRNAQLSTQAIAFLKKLDKDIDYPFHSRDFQRKAKNSPLDQKQLTQQLYSARKMGRAVQIESWSPHDLRRTVRTGLARLKCPSEVAEAILGHSKEGIKGTYDLHHYEDEAKEWLQKWCDYLDELVN